MIDIFIDKVNISIKRTIIKYLVKSSLLKKNSVSDITVFLKLNTKIWLCPKKLFKKKWQKDLSWWMFKTSRDFIVIYLCFRFFFLL